MPEMRMTDEERRKSEEVQAHRKPEVERNQQATQDISTNEQVIERLAQAIPKAFMSAFESELAEKMSRARAEIDRTTIVAQQIREEIAPTPAARLSFDTDEKKAEYLRFVVHGRPMRKEVMGYDHETAMRMIVPGGVTQAITPATGSAGGYLVPEDFRAELEKRAQKPRAIWPLCTIRPTTRESVVKPEVTAYPSVNTGTSANSKSSTSTDKITETEPTFSELTWTMRYSDAKMRVKLDAIDDSPLSLVEELTQLAADAFMEKRESLPLTGGGSTDSEPLGLLDSSAGITEVAYGGAASVDNTLKGFNQLPVRYRSNATAVMDTQTLMEVVSNLATNVNSAQFLNNYLPAMVESEDMTEGKILVGDFRRYVIYQNRLMRLVSNVDADTFSLVLAWVEKWDGQPTITDAFRILTGVTYA